MTKTEMDRGVYCNRQESETECLGGYEELDGGWQQQKRLLRMIVTRNDTM